MGTVSSAVVGSRVAQSMAAFHPARDSHSESCFNAAIFPEGNAELVIDFESCKPVRTKKSCNVLNDVSVRPAHGSGAEFG